MDLGRVEIAVSLFFCSPLLDSEMGIQQAGKNSNCLMSGASNKCLMLDTLATKFSLLPSARMVGCQISFLGGNWLSYADSQGGSH